MTATNHVVTGALIVTFVANPVLGLVLALISHPVLDMIPHYGVEPENIKVFLPGLLIDMFIAASVLVALLVTQPENYMLIVTGGVVAASPDLLSIPRFIHILQNKPHQHGAVQRFLGWIQWSQTVPGLAVEIMWFLGVGSILLGRL